MPAQDQALEALRREVVKLRGDVDRLSRNQRSTNLNRASIDDYGGVSVVLDGLQRSLWGVFDDGVVATKYMNGPAPAAPTAPVVDARQLALVIYWDGGFVGGKAPGDLQRVDVHVDVNAGFACSGANVVHSFLGEGVVMVPAGVEQLFVQLRAVTTSDVPSEPSAEVSNTPLPVQQFAARSVGTLELATNLLLASTIEMQNLAGDTTILLDGQTGNALLSGEYRTANSGLRIVANPAGASFPELRLYPRTGSRYGLIQAYEDTNAADVWTGGILLRGGYDPDKDAADVTGRIRLFRNAIDITYGPSANPNARIHAFENNVWLTARNQLSFEASEGLLFTFSEDNHIFRKRIKRGGTSGFYFEHVDSDGQGTPDAQVGIQANSNGAAWIRGANYSGIVFGGFEAPAINCVSSGGTIAGGLVPCRASSFPTSSSRTVKEQVAPVPFDSLSAILAAPVSQWQYVTDREAAESPDTGFSAPARHISPMAEDLPAELVEGSGVEQFVDTRDLVGVLWDAVRALVLRIHALEEHAASAGGDSD